MVSLKRQVGVSKRNLSHHHLHGLGIFGRRSCQAVPSIFCTFGSSLERCGNLKHMQACSRTRHASCPRLLRPRRTALPSAESAGRSYSALSCPEAAASPAGAQKDPLRHPLPLWRTRQAPASWALGRCLRLQQARVGPETNRSHASQTESNILNRIQRFSSSIFCIILISARCVLSASVAKLKSSASCPAPSVIEQILDHDQCPLMVLNHPGQKQAVEVCAFRLPQRLHLRRRQHPRHRSRRPGLSYPASRPSPWKSVLHGPPATAS